MAAFAIIPAAPVLLADIDGLESARTAELRSGIEDLLATQTSWALPVDTLPPVAGLGGWGIDRGIVTRTGEVLTGTDWVEAVRSLSASQREASEIADPAIIVGLLHAHAAGVEVGARDTSENMLAPIDLSAAASADAPLAPVDGAADFDDQVVATLTCSDLIDVSTLLVLTAEAQTFHANLTALEAGVGHLSGLGRRLGNLEVIFDEHVHEVRSLCAAGDC